MSDRTPTGDLDAADPGHSLRPLGRLHDYQIVDGDPDVRGWAVLGSDGVQVGEVSDLLVDTDAGQVRYLDVAIDTDRLDASATTATTGDETPRLLGAPTGTVTAHAAMAGLAPLITESVVRSTLSDEENALTRDQHHGFESRHVLVPIGHARLDPQHDQVHLEDLTAGQIAELPDYDYGNLDRDAEARLRQYFDRTSGHAPGSDVYASPSFDADRFYGARRRTGPARTDTARTAGLAQGNESSGGAPARPVTGELDRAGETAEPHEVGARRS
ncbi:MAG: photosynthetic reaction center subunit [Acidobacteriota bacterium]|jgi:hypothetical protein|nr:photosynthetic reaction center subunit [Acidobacteriota bacterium]